MDAAYFDALVVSAPPLTTEQAERLGELLPAADAAKAAA